MKQAFVTGATGFVGINLVQELLEQGWAVTALHRASSDLSYLKRFEVELAEASLHERERLVQAIPEGTDTVFHVAGNTNMWRRGNAEQTRDNVEGTRNVVEASLDRGVRRIVVTSSVAAYGTHQGEITEETPSRAPKSWINYQRTKWQAEQEVRQVMERGIEAVFLNPCVVLGPYDFGSWSKMFVLIRDGKLKQSPPGSFAFCHVREVARAHLAAADRGENGANYLLGGTHASFPEMTQIMAELLGKTMSERPVPAWGVRLVARLSEWWSYLSRREPNITPEAADLVTQHLIVHGEKAKTELGYQPVPLREMLEDDYRWLKADGRL